jgi:hypothetical protein
MARHGKVGCELVRYGRHGEPRLVTVWEGEIWQPRFGMVSIGEARRDAVRRGSQGWVWLAVAWRGVAGLSGPGLGGFGGDR